jgi:CRP-like cAMP-binding protein
MIPAEALKEIYLFRGASPEDLAAVAAITERRDLLPGDVVYRAGEPADAMFHIEMGTIELAKSGAQVVFATLGNGQTVG